MIRNELKVKLLATILVALAAPGCTHMANTNPAAEGEARLAKMLEGRTAGEPQSCIPARIGNGLEIIDETAIVYDAGNTIWVARPENPGSLDDDDILVIERFGSQLCKQDVIRTVDQMLGFTTGVVFLDDFVPYRKN